MFGVFNLSIGASFTRPKCLVRADVDRSDGLTLLRLDSGAKLEVGLVTVVLPTWTSSSLDQQITQTHNVKRQDKQ